MYVETDLSPERVRSGEADGATDRFALLNVFAPLQTSVRTAFERIRDAAILDWIIGIPTDLVPGHRTGRGPVGASAPLTQPRPAVHYLDSQTADRLRRARDLGDLHSAVADAQAQVRAALSARRLAGRSPRPRPFFSFGGRSPRVLDPTVVSLMQSEWNLSLIDHALRIYPMSTPADASEIGLLFLDRTRIRPVRRLVGEHLESIPLLPGQEALVEVRTTVRRTVSIEDAIEREFEETLEQSTQTTETDTSTQSTQGTSSETGTTTQSFDVSGKDPTGSIPVDASASVSSGQTVSSAETASVQQSLTTASETTARVSSRLRQNHKVTVKRETQETFERFTRDTLRSRNNVRPATVHYYRLLEEVTLQQQRTGVRLCWAPFLVDPGRGLRVRALGAYQAIIDAAVAAVKLPTMPVPPQRQFATIWRAGGKISGDLSGLGVIVAAPGARGVRVPVVLEEGDTWTGRVRARFDGEAKDVVQRSETRIVEGPDADGHMTAEVTFDTDWVWGAGTLETTVEVEVTEEVPGFDDKQAAYQQRLQDHDAEATRRQNAARQDAQPRALEARNAILEAASVRDELITGVLSQIVRSFLVVPVADIELWHRMLDFDNLGYTTYPGWRAGSELAVPDLPARHLVNTDVARVFLPVRPGYEQVALDRIFAPRELSPDEAATFADFARTVTDEVKKRAEELRPDEPLDLGDPWTDRVPLNGAHAEVEISVTDALDRHALRELEQTLDRTAEEVAALSAENQIRAAVSAPSETVLNIGSTPP